MNYERRLFAEYRKKVRSIEMKAAVENQVNVVDTNMTADQNFLMTRMPIMDYSF